MINRILSKGHKQYNFVTNFLITNALFHKSSRLLEQSAFNMPSMSPTMTHGKIVRWNKKEGEEFKQGDILLEIETDKAQIDVDAADDGFMLKILFEEGSENIKIGETIAYIGEEKEDVENFTLPNNNKEAISEEQTHHKEKDVTTDSPSRSNSSHSPAVLNLLKTHNLNPETIKATGPHGRLLKGDILKHMSDKKVENIQPKENMHKPDNSFEKNTQSSQNYTRIPLSGVRSIIAKRLTESKQNIPHTYVMKRICMDNVTKLREELKAKGTKISVNDFIIKAVGLSLQDVPEINVKYTDSSIQSLKEIDVSIAVATPNGLITPIIKDCNTRSVRNISETLKELAKRARENKLKPHEYQGGSFSISNLGMFDIKQFTAVINPPQSAILAVGSSAQEVMIKDNIDIVDVNQGSDVLSKYLCIKSYMNVSLSIDSRAIELNKASEFLNRMAFYLEDTSNMI